MENGKPAGVRCVNLREDYSCAIYNDPDYPKVCAEFNAEKDFCGVDREDAMRILGALAD